MSGGSKRHGIVCAGNLIVDRVHTLSYWPEQGNLAHIKHQDIGVGGGAVNVVMDLASLGLTARLALAGCVGNDADGQLLRNIIAAKGIDVEAVQPIEAVATGHTHVMNVPGQSRTFFYHGGANERLDEKAIDVGELSTRNYRFFYLGYLMLLPGLDTLDKCGRSGASRLLEKAQAAGLETCVDFVSSEEPQFAAQVAASLPYCDYLIINEIEAGRATGLSIRTADGCLQQDVMEQAAQSLLKCGVRRGVIIHAPELSLWLAPGESAVVTRSCTVNATEIVSPVGAGDAFCASILYGLHEGWSREKTASIAHRAAARCLTGATATDGIPPMATLVSEWETTSSRTC